MEHLKQAVKDSITARFNKVRERIKTPEGLQEALNFEGKSYKGDDKTKREKFLRYLKNRESRALNNELLKIDLVANSSTQSFTTPLIITVEWKRSRIWGMNPRASTNYGFVGSSISGCGYCKLSTATAEALNSFTPLVRLMYEKVNEALKHGLVNNRETLGYGSGHGILPYFEGGVGVTSHQKIVEGLGLKWSYITSTDSVDVFQISKEAE